MATWKKLLHESSAAGDFPAAITTVASQAAALETGRTFLVDLDETNASTAFTGAANCTDIGVTNTLGVANGGTNIASWTAGDILYASGSTTLAKLAKGTDGEVLTLASGIPSWASASSGDVTGVDAGTGITVNDGSTATPEVAVTAAQTGITSIYNSGLKVGYSGSDAYIDFSTDNNINFLIDGSSAVKIKSAGEIEAGSLDISGDADIDGTLETDALTIAGATIAAAGTTSITTLGTIGTGTWQGSTIAVGYTAAKCTDANADQTSANTCDTPHVATNISWTAGTTAGPTCNSSTGSDAAIPSASGSASGILTTGTQTIAGAKTFSSNLETSGNMIVGGNLQVTGTSTVTNTTVETVNVADSQIKLRAGTSSWRDMGLVFDRGGGDAATEGVVTTNAIDAMLYYDAGTGHLHMAGVAANLNEDDTTADDISATAGTENVHQVALCTNSNSTPSGDQAPIGSIAVDNDLNSGTPYVRIS